MRIVVIAALLALAPAVSFAHDNPTPAQPAKLEAVKAKAPVKPAQRPQHSGGTDAYGCHTNHATGVYHCHNPK